MKIIIVTVLLLCSCSDKDFILTPEDKFNQNPTLENCFNNGGEEYRLKPKDGRGPECVWRKKR